jgi:protein involved in polysaccharide export with SLBB domain
MPPGRELTGTKSLYKLFKNMKLLNYICVFGLMLLFVGCETARSDLGSGGNGTNVVQAVEAEVHYSPDAAVLRPGLTVKVDVFVSGSLEIDVETKRIPDQGVVIFPLVGDVAVNGLTLAELSSVLRKRYTDYLVKPEVVVQFDLTAGESPWGYVTVLGHVAKPGKVPIPATRDLTVSGAVQLAGGLGPSAKDSAIMLTRRLESGETVRSTINLRALAKRGDLEEDAPVRSGDVVYVPEKYL